LITKVFLDESTWNGGRLRACEMCTPGSHVKILVKSRNKRKNYNFNTIIKELTLDMMVFKGL